VIPIDVVLDVRSEALVLRIKLLTKNGREEKKKRAEAIID
jgi:hypothetical protein